MSILSDTQRIEKLEAENAKLREVAEGAINLVEQYGPGWDSADALKELAEKALGHDIQPKGRLEP